MAIAEPLDFLAVTARVRISSSSSSHLQTPLGEPPRDRGEAAPRVDRAQRMIAAFGPRHDDVGVAGEREQVGGKRRRHVRHVAGDEEYRVAARRGERRVQTAERPAARHHGSSLAADHDARSVVRASDSSAICRSRIVRPFNDERALVASAEAARLAAGKNGCTNTCGLSHDLILNARSRHRSRARRQSSSGHRRHPADASRLL